MVRKGRLQTQVHTVIVTEWSPTMPPVTAQQARCPGAHMKPQHSVGGPGVIDQPGLHNEVLSKYTRAEAVAQWLECSPSMCEVLGSSPSTANKT